MQLRTGTKVKSVNSPRSFADQPLVSCIIIFFNEERYLAEAIQSVLTQTYRNWELLLVDDGSSDRSGDLARQYVAEQPKRIRYLTHVNGANCGMSASRNLGLESARGTYVAFLDADDAWYPDKLARQVALFAEHRGAVLACGATLYWHGWEAHNGRADSVRLVGETPGADGEPISSLEQDRLYAPGMLMKQLYPLGRGVTPSSSGMMVRLDVALAVGGFEASFRGLFEDQVFLAKMLLAGPVYVSKAVFDRYRQHSESCSNMVRDPGERDRLRRAYLAWLQSYLDHIGCRDSAIRSKLRLAILRIDHPRAYALLRKAGGWRKLLKSKAPAAGPAT